MANEDSKKLANEAYRNVKEGRRTVQDLKRCNCEGCQVALACLGIDSRIRRFEAQARNYGQLSDEAQAEMEQLEDRKIAMLNSGRLA